MSAGVLALGYGVFAIDPLNGSPPYFAFGLSAALMRTWGRPIGAPSSASFAGIEFTSNIAFIKLTLGQYFKLGEATTSSTRLSTWSAGFGF